MTASTLVNSPYLKKPSYLIKPSALNYEDCVDRFEQKCQEWYNQNKTLSKEEYVSEKDYLVELRNCGAISKKDYIQKNILLNECYVNPPEKPAYDKFIKEHANIVNNQLLKEDPTVKIFENGLSIEAEGNKLYRPKRTNIRGQINTFSRKSRNNLMRKFSQIKQDILSKPLFITLTYHYGYTVDEFKAITDLNVFLQALRDRWNVLYYIWRLELQKRGAPHFHIILWLPNYMHDLESDNTQIWLNNAWHRIADPNSRRHAQYGCKIIPMENYKHVVCYLSKYIAKEDEAIEHNYTGRRWGNSRNLPIEPYKIVSLNQSQYYILRRIIRKWLQSKSKKCRKYARSFLRISKHYIFLGRNVAEKLIEYVLKIPLATVKEHSNSDKVRKFL